MTESVPIRYRPPSLPQHSDLQDIFRVAFGPAAPMPRSVIAFGPCEGLGLAARIASRHEPAALARMLGPDAPRRLAQHRLASLAAHRRITASGSVLVSCARALGIPVVLMKHAGLWARGLPVEGCRLANDLDVLVRSADARRLWSALLAEGYFDAGHGDRPHHLATLDHAQNSFVEIHTVVPGVNLRNAPATLDALVSAQLVTLAAAFDRDVLVPTWELLAAHALVHGYVQHGATPTSYPLTRMLCDLADLGVGERPVELATKIEPWIRHGMRHEETLAVFRLVQVLVRGAFPSEGSAEEAVLAHVVMGALDEDYQRALRLSRLSQMVTRNRWREGLRRLFLANPAEVELPARTSQIAIAARSPRHTLRILHKIWSGVEAAVRIRRRRRDRARGSTS